MTQNESETIVEELEQTIASIFQAMMGLDVKVVDLPWSEEPRRMEATVHITGRWSAVIVLEVTPDQACFLAGRFLSIDTPEAVDNDVRDVLGELANMIGGNLKCAVVPDATLSIPEVVDGTNFSVRLCGAGAISRRAFEFDAGVFWASLIESRSNSHEF